MTSKTDYYAECDAILRHCTHTDKYRSEVRFSATESLLVCCDCWNAYVMARRAVRKQQLVDEKLTLPACDRCGKLHAGSWRVAQYHLCGKCKNIAMQDHEQSVMACGNLAFIAGTSGQYMGDTSTWACQKGALSCQT